MATDNAHTQTQKIWWSSDLWFSRYVCRQMDRHTHHNASHLYWSRVTSLVYSTGLQFWAFTYCDNCLLGCYETESEMVIHMAELQTSLVKFSCADVSGLWYFLRYALSEAWSNIVNRLLTYWETLQKVRNQKREVESNHRKVVRMQ